MVAVRIRRQARRRRQEGPDGQSVEAVPSDATRLLQDTEDVLTTIDATLE
jgi:hypothetical protein